MQPQDLPAGVEDLARHVVTEIPLDDTLHRVAQLATREVTGCDMAGITLLRDGRPVTAVFTDETAPEIDTAQYESGEGPCLEASRTGKVLRIHDTRTEARWPDFAAAAAAAGVFSTLSLPLTVGVSTIGALNLYSREVDAFVDGDDAPFVLSAQAAVVLANSQAYWASRLLAEQLQTALESRAVIEQAKGIIMGTTRCTPDEAFDRLRLESQHQNRKLRDVARDVVEAAAGPPDPVDPGAP